MLQSPSTSTVSLKSATHPPIPAEVAPFLRVRQGPPIDIAKRAATSRPIVAGKHLEIDGDCFLIKAVTYGTFRNNDAGEPFPPFWQLKDDFARMRDAGINTVRVYTPPSDRIADAAEAAGLYLVPDICWGPRTCEWEYDEWWRKSVAGTRQEARRLGGHPAVLMLSIGNEIPPLVVRWYGREKTERCLRILHDAVKEECPDSLVTYVNHPPTEYLNLPFLDVVSFNVYLNRERDFRAYLARLHTLAGNRPLFLAEMGRDSTERGESEQSEYLDWQLRAIFEKGLCGAAVYSWTDDWSIFDSTIDGWTFGLTTADRQPKPALAAVSRVYRSSLYDLRSTPWPRVSVVVAVYNGAATLRECLTRLQQIDYPNFEVIVVNDGSTDGTRDIIEQFNFRAIHVPNGGLSRARNLGIEAATGEIVAFIDGDAYPAASWLYYLVTSLVEQHAEAVGGPNIVPQDAGFTEQCVDASPGNPTHVLFDDERAEHVPGCNMAYRKETLVEIGGFDPDHRAAGDDVDLCWRLLVRNHTIAFSPSAVVYHHRRETVGAYLRQQRGYGFAESYLKRRYPGRYNVFGHQVWRGHVYDSVGTGLRRHGLPLLFPSRIYQGRFAGEPFQSIYQPFLNWWVQIFTTFEWQVLTAGLLLSGILGTSAGQPLASVPLAAGAAMLLLCLVSAIVCASYATGQKQWPTAKRLSGVALVALLHLAQPLARAHGRLRGWWNERGSESSWPGRQRLYGNLWQRSQLLDGLLVHLRACGWIGVPASEWSEHDIEVPGPGPYQLFLTTVYEDDVEHGVHYVRYRITSRAKPYAPFVVGALTVALIATLVQPWLWPLALPVGYALLKFATARRAMVEALSQLTMEYGQVLGMTKALDDF